MPSDYRLTFDEPYNFAVEPGYTLSKFCTDFRNNPLATDPTLNESGKVYRDPVTGLLMLAPSFLNSNFSEDFRPLSDWNYKSGFFKEVIRAAPVFGTSEQSASMFTTIKAATSSPSLIDLLTNLAIIVIEKSLPKGDDLKWSLESKFYLEADEAWVIHYHGLSDEMARKHNWFAIQVDNLYLHFSQTGNVRVMQYPDRGNLTIAPIQVDEFQIASPGDLLNRPGYFIFLPIPGGRGIAVYHSFGPEKQGLTVSNAFAGVTKGHVIPWPDRYFSGKATLLDRSLIRIALNPYMGHVIGFQHVTYPASGEFVDAVFDPGYTPSSPPDYVDAPYLPTGHGSVTAELIKPNMMGSFVVGTDRQARGKITLNGDHGPFTDGKYHYTPFVESWGVKWSPIFNTRNTTPVEVDRLFHVEYTKDEAGRMEGRASLLADNHDLVRILLRGDTTFRLERRSNENDPWSLVFCGLAEISNLEMKNAMSGQFFTAEAHLHDMWKRFEEIHQNNIDAYDGMRIGDAVNRLLPMSGFPPIAFVPNEVNQTRVPSISGQNKGQTWRFSSKAGDDGAVMIRSLLLLLRRQFVEWLLVYDWDNFTWAWVKKNRETSPAWTLNPLPENENTPGKILLYLSISIDPQPPEFNGIQVIGLSDTDPAKAKRVPSAPVTNPASLYDPSSPDYLGRTKVIAPEIAVLEDFGELSKMARRIAATAMHRHLKMKVEMPRYIEGIQPTTLVQVENINGSAQLTWLKQRTDVWDQEEGDRMKLTFDDVWESEVKL